MSKQLQKKFNWQKILGSFAIFSATIGTIESLPAGATSSLAQNNAESTEVAGIDSAEPSMLLQFDPLDHGAVQQIAHRHHRHHRHGRRYTRGYMKKKFGFNRRHGHRVHGHHSGHRRRRTHFRGFKKHF